MPSFTSLCAMAATSLGNGDEIYHQGEAPNTDEDWAILDTPNKVYDSFIQDEGLKPDESTKMVGLAAECAIVDSSADNDGDGSGSTIQDEFIVLALHKESGVEEGNYVDNSKKVIDREVIQKTSQPKSRTVMAKKNRDGKIGPVTSKQPLAIATNQRLSNDRQISGSITGLDSGRPTKLQTRPSHTPSLATNTTDPKGLKEEARRPKPLKQGQPTKVEGNSDSSSSPEAGGMKPQRTGGLPSYGFSFKCDERAQRRKEFYAHLEEKIHAKEVEKTTMHAKTQENQEAEIKMLRKSLMFKATPMPSFYQEPVLPKVELKKIPPTRAKSPKFGRSRSSHIKDSDGNKSHSSQSSRLSLDEKMTLNKIAKGSSPQHYKKPLRKSLSKLPSEKTTLANVKEDSASMSQLSEQPNIEPVAKQISETIRGQTDINAEAEAAAIE